MAKGFLGFLGFGKREKPNLTQAFQSPPPASSAPLSGDIQDFAKKRIRGEDTGFGDDFASLANPAIQARKTRFREETVPTLSNQASARGLGRSSIVTDQIGRAERDTQNDIDQLLSQFEVLNRKQQKADVTEGVNVGQNVNTQFLNQGNVAAQAFNEAERGNTERTVGQSNARNQRSDQMQDRTMQALGQLISPVLGDAYKSAFPNAASSKRDAAGTNFLNNAGSETSTKILSSSDSDLGSYDISSLVQALKLVGSGGGM